MKLLFLIPGFFSALAAGDPPHPEHLLKDSDRARGAAASTGGLSWKAVVDSVENGNANQVTYKIRVRGDNAIAEAIAPARNKGETMLFNDRNLWFYKTGLRKPISISPRQKLMGQAANGDIASTNYARDYSGKIDAPEIVNGKPTWRMELQAKAKNVTYDRIRYWVSSDTRLAVRAEFITLSGETFKKAEFEYKNTLTLEQKTVPFISKMVITDAKQPANRTEIVYESPKIETHPASLFNINNLIR